MNFLRMVFVLFVACLATSAVRADGPDSDLKFVLIVTRHGVRPPLAKDAYVAKMAAQPWPKWEVPAEFLTPHGAQLLTILGGYYRALYIREGLLTGNPALDAAHVFLQADSDERTIESTRRLGLALLPGCQPEVKALPAGTVDPLFRAFLYHLGHPDMALALEAVQGRIGHDLPAVVRAHQAALDEIDRVLFGAGGQAPPGKLSPLALGGTRVSPEIRANNDQMVTVEPFHKCMTVTENFLLEYEDGIPMEDVGWGRVTPATLTSLLELHSVYWDLAQRTFYVAQVQGSDLAAHILKTLDQAVTAQPQKGAFGSTADRLVVIGAHDTNLINLSGLLGITWTMPGMQMNPVPPGCALVFEVRQRRSDSQYVVRVQFVSQTLDQLRYLQPLTLEHPPFTAPIFIPGCSGAEPGSDAPYEKFKALLERVIDREFTDM